MAHSPTLGYVDATHQTLRSQWTARFGHSTGRWPMDRLQQIAQLLLQQRLELLERSHFSAIWNACILISGGAFAHRYHAHGARHGATEGWIDFRRRSAASWRRHTGGFCSRIPI